MTEHAVAAATCPSCEARVDPAEYAKGPRPPQPGDFLLCRSCGAALRYTTDMDLREARATDLASFQGEQRTAMEALMASGPALLKLARQRREERLRQEEERRRRADTCPEPRWCPDDGPECEKCRDARSMIAGVVDHWTDPKCEPHGPECIPVEKLTTFMRIASTGHVAGKLVDKLIAEGAITASAPPLPADAVESARRHAELFAELLARYQRLDPKP